MKPTHKAVYTMDIKLTRVSLAHRQLQERASDAAPK